MRGHLNACHQSDGTPFNVFTKAVISYLTIGISLSPKCLLKSLTHLNACQSCILLKGQSRFHESISKSNELVDVPYTCQLFKSLSPKCPLKSLTHERALDT